MLRLKTYFEQVPLEVVKKIVEQEEPSRKTTSDETPGAKKKKLEANGSGISRIRGQLKDHDHSIRQLPTANQRWSTRLAISSPTGRNIMNDGELKYPSWQAPLQEVILEFDREKLPERIQKVEALILDRLQQLSRGNDSRSEQEAISDALSILRIIKRDKLGYPDWK
jgi:hypothetical protein